MYGRAKLDVLRQRVLHAARGRPAELRRKAAYSIKSADEPFFHADSHA